MSGHEAASHETRRYLLIAAGLVVAVAALGAAVYLLMGGGMPRLFGAEPGPPGTVAYQLHGGEGSPVTVHLEVAATPAARQQGLSNRDHLPDGRGMVFLFPDDVDGAFWMKDTRVPLSIAFVAADGRVAAIREMTPCTADPCPTYSPGTKYRYAVELPAGAFAAAGVEEGDRVVPVDRSALPTPS